MGAGLQVASAHVLPVRLVVMHSRCKHCVVGGNTCHLCKAACRAPCMNALLGHKYTPLTLLPRLFDCRVCKKTVRATQKGTTRPEKVVSMQYGTGMSHGIRGSTQPLHGGGMLPSFPAMMNIIHPNDQNPARVHLHGSHTTPRAASYTGSLLLTINNYTPEGPAPLPLAAPGAGAAAPVLPAVLAAALGPAAPGPVPSPTAAAPAAPDGPPPG